MLFSNKESKNDSGMKLIPETTEYDYLCKVVLAGSAETSEKHKDQQGVGKTSLLNCLDPQVQSDKRTETTPTIGVEYKTVSFEGVIDKNKKTKTSVNVQFWDQATQERYRTLTTGVYKGAHVVCWILDATQNPDAQLKKFKDEIKFFDSPFPKIVVIATKVDEQKKVIDGQGLQTLTKKLGQEMKLTSPIPLFECSAKTGKGVQEALGHVAWLSARVASGLVREDYKAERNQNYSFTTIRENLKEFIRGTDLEQNDTVIEFLAMLQGDKYDWNAHEKFRKFKDKNNQFGGWIEAYQYSHEHMDPDRFMGAQYFSWTDQNKQKIEASSKKSGKWF